MVSWLAYTASAGVVVAVLAVGAGALIGSADAAALGVAAAVAWGVQVVAFAALLRAHRRGAGLLAGWAGGIALRFAAVAGLAVWVTRSPALDPATALVGLVGFVLVLALLEPVFLRLAD